MGLIARRMTARRKFREDDHIALSRLVGEIFTTPRKTTERETHAKPGPFDRLKSGTPRFLKWSLLWLYPVAVAILVCWGAKQ